MSGHPRKTKEPRAIVPKTFLLRLSPRELRGVWFTAPR
jgi:hypothetical protein